MTKIVYIFELKREYTLVFKNKKKTKSFYIFLTRNLERNLTGKTLKTGTSLIKDFDAEVHKNMQTT